MDVIKDIKILGAVLELPANQNCQFGPFTKKWGKMGRIGSAVEQDFDFFNCHGCQKFISYEIHCYLSSRKS